MRLASQDAGRRHRGRSKPTPRPQRRRQLGTGPADKRRRRKHACRLAAPNGGANSSWQVGRQGPASTTHGPLPRPALKDRECQPGTRLKSAAKPLKISQVQSKTAKFRVGHRNQAEGRGMSEAVTVEDKTNRYNANATGKQEQLWPASPDAHTTMAPASGRHLDYGGGPADSARAAFK